MYQLKSKSQVNIINKIINNHFINLLDDLRLLAEEDANLNVIENVINKYGARTKYSLFNSAGMYALNDINIFKTGRPYFNIGLFDEELKYSNGNELIKVLFSRSGYIIVSHEKDECNISGYTPVKTTTGIAYNYIGVKMFTLTAKGSFWYNGKSSSVTYADGSLEKEFFGSTLNIDVKALGAPRTVIIQGNRYSEVYSRLYVESVIGFKWAGLVVNSATVEVNVGTTVTGNLYGNVKTI